MVADGQISAVRIIPSFEVVEEAEVCLRSIGKRLPLGKFAFECSKERFAHGVAAAVISTRAAHLEGIRIPMIFDSWLSFGVLPRTSLLKFEGFR